MASLPLKTALIGAASAAALIAGLVIGMNPSKAEPVIGDIRNYRPDPAYLIDRPSPARPADVWSRPSYPGRDLRDDGLDEGPRGFPRLRRYRHPVSASGSVGGDLPFELKEWRATRLAITQWKARVAESFGRDFANWRVARDKQVYCDGGAGRVFCEVSARPARSDGRWGPYGER